MKSSLLRSVALGIAAALSLSTVSMTPAWGQDATRTTVEGLSENQGYIRGCRQLNRGVEVFDNSSLGPASNRIGTLNAGVQVRLTGVLASGRAQIFLEGQSLSSVQPVGWITAAALTACGSTPPPVNRACFRANNALNVRAGASSNTTLITTLPEGNTLIATTNPPTQQTSPNAAPDFGRIWMAITLSSGNTGWVARTGPNGQGSNVTAIPCP